MLATIFICADNIKIKGLQFYKINYSKLTVSEVAFILVCRLHLPHIKCSFLAMRRIITYFRSTINQDRFTKLSILQIEKDIDNILSKIFTKKKVE